MSAFEHVRHQTLTSQRNVSMILFMHIYSTLAASDLESIAQRLGIITYNVADHGMVSRGRNAGKHKVSLVLRPQTGSDRYRAFADYSGRRKWAVTWEGHRDFMTNVFARDQSATIDSALARYRGVQEFLDLYPLTGSDLNHGFKAKVAA